MSRQPARFKAAQGELIRNSTHLPKSFSVRVERGQLVDRGACWYLSSVPTTPKVVSNLHKARHGMPHTANTQYISQRNEKEKLETNSIKKSSPSSMATKNMQYKSHLKEFSNLIFSRKVFKWKNQIYSERPRFKILPRLPLYISISRALTAGHTLGVSLLNHVVDQLRK